MKKNKKTFIIIGVVLIIGVIAYFVYKSYKKADYTKFAGEAVTLEKAE